MKIAFVDYRISDLEKSNLEKLGLEVLIVPPCNILYEAICGHPDILLHLIDNKSVLVHKNINLDFIKILENYNMKVFCSSKSLGSTYPSDIILNALNINNIFLHNLKYSDTKLLEVNKGKKLLHTKQGYTKCSTAIISQNAVITSDISITRILSLQGLDVLFVPPGDICLPGLNYGFIGGTCGLVDSNTIAFYGSLKNYKYGKEVIEFLNKHHVKPVYLSEGKLVDRGSILLVNSEK